MTSKRHLVPILLVLAGGLPAACGVSDNDVAEVSVVEEFGTQQGSLVSLSTPASVVEFSVLTIEALDGDVLTLGGTVEDVLFVDSARPEVEPPSLGSTTIWASMRTTWGSDFDVTTLRDREQPEYWIALLGYFAQYSDGSDQFPGPHALMLLAAVEEGEVTFVGPAAEQLKQEYGRASAVADTSPAETLVALARELAVRDAALASGESPASVPLLQAISPTMTPAEQWLQRPADERDVVDAPDEIREGLDQVTVIVDFEPGTDAPGYVFGIISPAGWAGAATMDVPYGIAWPILVEPSSTIEFVIASETPDREPRRVVAKLDAAEWKSGDAIYLLVTKAMVAAVVDGTELPDAQRPSIVDSTTVRQLIDSQATRNGAGADSEVP